MWVSEDCGTCFNTFSCKQQTGSCRLYTVCGFARIRAHKTLSVSEYSTCLRSMTEYHSRICCLHDDLEGCLCSIQALKPFRIFYITCPSFPEQVQGGYEEKPLSKFLLTAPRNHRDSVCKNSFWAAERGKRLYKHYLHHIPRGPRKSCPNV